VAPKKTKTAVTKIATKYFITVSRIPQNFDFVEELNLVYHPPSRGTAHLWWAEDVILVS
jgi:hypothetical protein